MPINDLTCRHCGAQRDNVYMPLRTLHEPIMTHGYLTATYLERPVCCGESMEIVPPRVTVDLAFTPFDTEVRQPDGSYKTVRVSTLNDIRRLERSTEQAARNGEGEALRWRDYSQDRSNTDVHTFGAAPDAAPSIAAKQRFAKVASTVEPEASLGPGVTDESSTQFGDA